MEKFLRPKDRILLGLALMGDLYGEMFESIGVTIRKIYGILPPDYKTTNLYNTLYRSLITGDIRKVIKKGQAYYQLTNVGKKRLKRNFPLFKLQQRKWDGWWRIVIFDIKEKNRRIRRLLRNKLKELGFGMWQKSVYITPFNAARDIRQFLVVHGLGEQACVFVAKHLFAGDVKKLVVNIWQLDDLNKQYEDLIDNWEWAKSPAANLSKPNLKKKARESYAKYLEIIAKDPFLPKSLLPADWWADDAGKLIKEWVNYFE